MAPAVFRGYYELPAALVACAVLVLAVLYRDPRSRFNRRPLHPAWLSLAALCLTLAVTLACQVSEARRGARVTLRSFYGRLQVVEEGEPNSPWFMRKLKHGTITHGLQYLHPQRIQLPTAYYGSRSGGGLAILNANRDSPQRVGLIGLGAGVMAAYGRAGDLYRFYEINPQVVKLARSQFTYLTQSPAKVEVKLGDARLSLEREANQEFDVLVVDAFASDSIPVHLLTLEATELYFRHLKREGVLAVHISNRYLNLEPVLECAARQMGKAALLIEDQPPRPAAISVSTWVLLANRKEVFEQSAFKKAGSAPEPQAGLRTWTDDYSNLFQTLK